MSRASAPGILPGVEAVIFVGIQGSGKSTFYCRRFFDTHVRINLDMLRTRRREWIVFEACLRAGQRLVVDNTNPTRADRQRYLPALKEAHFRTVAYWFDMPLEDCLARNAVRPGKQNIPERAVRMCHQRIEPPTREEGFDAVYRVRMEGEQFVVEEAEF